jgi:hypothetical protein
MVSFLDEKILPCSLSDTASPRKAQRKKNYTRQINPPKGTLKVVVLAILNSNFHFDVLMGDFLIDCKIYPSYRQD